jgi:ubiquinone/menaquinone biosynthesis C-methylase UbiE
MSINFDRAADYYDDTRGYRADVAQAIGRALAAAAHASPNTRFLEIGVGTGRIALPLIALGHDYTGVDISVAMMDRLRAKLDALARAAGIPPRVTLLEADMQALPFADGQFDAVIAAHVFHLVADPVCAWHEAMRVLRPGGALLICGDEADGDAPMTIGTAWHAIVREQYGAVPNAGETTGRLIREQVALDADARVDELRPVQWEIAATPREELDVIRRRLWSNTWRLPDDVFARCFAALETWTAQRYAGRMEAPIARRSMFVIRRVRRG